MTSFLFSAFGRKLVQAFSCFPIMFDAQLQMLVIRVLFQLWQESAQGAFSVADKSVVQLCPPAELFSAKIDLNNRGVFWENCW